MPLNIFGALGALGHMLPGYVQGERQAVDDNWRDLQQYNQAQHGQYANAFDAAMFNPRLSMGYDQAALSRMGVYDTGMQTNINRAVYPSALANALIQSQFQPAISTAMNLGQLGAGLGMTNMYWNPQSSGYWGQLAPAVMGGMPGPQRQQINPQQFGAAMLPSGII